MIIEILFYIGTGAWIITGCIYILIFLIVLAWLIARGIEKMKNKGIKMSDKWKYPTRNERWKYPNRDFDKDSTANLEN